MVNYSPNVNKNTNPATKGVAISVDTPFFPCASVNAAVAGASTVTWLDGTTTSYYFTQGVNPIQIQNIASGGASSGFIALYNT